MKVKTLRPCVQQLVRKLAVEIESVLLKLAQQPHAHLLNGVAEDLVLGRQASVLVLVQPLQAVVLQVALGVAFEVQRKQDLVGELRHVDVLAQGLFQGLHGVVKAVHPQDQQRRHVSHLGWPGIVEEHCEVLGVLCRSKEASHCGRLPVVAIRLAYR